MAKSIPFQSESRECVTQGEEAQTVCATMALTLRELGTELQQERPGVCQKSQVPIERRHASLGLHGSKAGRPATRVTGSEGYDMQVGKTMELTRVSRNVLLPSSRS